MIPGLADKLLQAAMITGGCLRCVTDQRRFHWPGLEPYTPLEAALQCDARIPQVPQSYRMERLPIAANPCRYPGCHRTGMTLSLIPVKVVAGRCGEYCRTSGMNLRL